MAPLTFYDNAMAYNTARVRIVLAEKDLPYKTVYINLMNGESLSPTYARINPHLWAPTLVLPDGKVLVDSVSCSKYVDSADEKPLGIQEGVDAAKVNEWVDLIAGWDGNLFMRAQGSATVISVLSQANAFKIKYAAARAKENPDLKDIYEKKIAQFEKDGAPSNESIEANYAELTALLGKAESALASSPFIAGPAYSLADAHFTTVIWRIHSTGAPAAARFLDPTKYPKVTAYFEKVKARPSYAKAFPAPGISSLLGVVKTLAKFKYAAWTGSY